MAEETSPKPKKSGKGRGPLEEGLTKDKEPLIPVRDKQKYADSGDTASSPPDTDQTGDSDIQDTGPKQKP